MTTQKEWEKICKAFCKEQGYTLLFSNAGNMDCGVEDKDGHMFHLYADEMASIMGYKED